MSEISPLPDYSAQNVPPVIQQEMAGLMGALDLKVPRKRQVRRNLLIATWNIRAFGNLTERWLAHDDDSPKRDWRAMAAIAEIVSRFDVIAIQEIKRDLTALRVLAATLGPEWSFIVTDVNTGEKGNGERMGFLFDTARVRLSGLAGELSLPEPDDPFFDGLQVSAVFRQFARTPYAVSFSAGHDLFTLVTAHVIYGGGAEDRTDEIAALSRWLADWAERKTHYSSNLLLLGDFNIDRAGDENYEAFTSAGLVIPAGLMNQPRTVFDGGLPNPKKFYDQIAWYEAGDHRRLTLELVQAGSFDFSQLLYQTAPALSTRAMSYRVSDHLPLWVEFAASPRVQG
ncbi:MAG: endonuclease/exonuclease/phosphatase family protein [Rhodobacteraceae bacterium]|nr:endonuclease/exonuclease/phosphatase family protein [Paracoccaceae bacterium]